MDKPLLKFPEAYGQLTMLMVMLILFGAPITWLVSPIVSILYIITMLLLGYLLLRNVYSLEFYKDRIIYKRHFGKHVEEISYDNISWMKYEERVKGSYFTIYFKQPLVIPMLHVKSATLSSGESAALPEIKRLVALLQTKEVPLRVKPIKLKKLFEEQKGVTT